MSRPTKVQLSPLVAPVCLSLMLYAGGACAQVDLSGNWQPVGEAYEGLVAGGPPPGDFLGVPLNREGRALAARANPDALEELGNQCQLFLTTNLGAGFQGIEIRPISARLNESDVLAWYLSGTDIRAPTTIWVDGRSPPSPLALHTWGGSAVGHWEGATLAVSITNIDDQWLTHNFAPESDQSTVDMFLSREDNLLTMTYIIHDPVYLSAPWVRAHTFRLSEMSPNPNAKLARCLLANLVPEINDGGYNAAPLVPPIETETPTLNFMMNHYGIPPQIALGGKQEVYPEFQKTLSKVYRRPRGYCAAFCCLARGAAFRSGPLPMEQVCPAPTPAPSAASAEPRSTG